MYGSFTPAEIADCIDSLQKAGITAEQITAGALVAALNLADSGDLPAFRAADAVAASINGIGLEASA